MAKYQPPPLPSEVEELADKMGMTISDFKNWFTNENLLKEESRNALKAVSGLYRETKNVKKGTAATPGTFDSKKLDDIIEFAYANRGNPSGLQKFRDKGIPSWVLDSLTAQGYDINRPQHEQRASVLERLDALASNIKTSNDPNQHKQLGLLTGETAATPDTDLPSTWELDPTALAGLRNKVIARAEWEDTTGKKLESFIDAQMDQIMNPTEDPIQKATNELTLKSLQRQALALEGKLPVSQGTYDRKSSEFNLLKENLARSGNKITGDTPETAVGLSSTGAQAIGEFNSTWKGIEDAERRGEILSGAGTSLAYVGNQKGYAGQTLSNVGGALNLRSQVPGSLSYMNMMPQSDYSAAPVFGGILSAYGNQMNPYMTQYGYGVQGQWNQANIDAQIKAGKYNLAGTILGMGAYGLGAKMSLRAAKKDIHAVEEKDEDSALSSLSGKKLYRYNYKDEPDGEPRHLSLMADEAPKEILTPDGKHLDPWEYIGLLTSAVKSLNRKVIALEA